MLQIKTQDLTDFLINKDGKVANWWYAELGLSSNRASNIATLIEWGVKLSPATEFGKHFYWLDIQPTPLPEGWAGKYRKLLVKLTS